MMDEEWPRVYDQYKEIAEELTAGKTPGRILKTDAHNEAHIEPLVPAGSHILEIAEKVIEVAQKKHPEFQYRKGDIRSLPYKDNAFDLIMDFSTIDHVPLEDVDTILEQYRRCAKKQVFIVAWLSPVYTHDIQKGEIVQWVFPDKKFTELLKKYFSITKDRLIKQNIDGRYLKGFYLEVK